jgi:hypothetical protein
MMAFAGICLAAGFIVFPGYLAMYGWNYLAGYIEFPFINIYQGIILWSIVAIAGYIANNKKKYIIEMSSGMTDEELKKVIDNIKVAPFEEEPRIKK